MSDLECPYCEHEYEDDASEISRSAAEAADSRVDEECPECGKTFSVYVEWDPVYYCSKKEES